MLENKPVTEGIRSGSGSNLIAAAPHLLQCVGGGILRQSLSTANMTVLPHSPHRKHKRRLPGGIGIG